MTPIEQARANVAERYQHTYHKNAIMRGDWDNGSIVKAALAETEGNKDDE